LSEIKSSEILCVGTELLLGDIVNTNAAYLSKRLALLGINVYHHAVVGDNIGRLKDALKEAISRSELVVMTGGLGPTYDDMTKETVAAYFGRPLELHEESLDRLKRIFSGREIGENNKKQAYMPVGAIVFKNDNGTAPGLAVEQEDENGVLKTVIMLPGPPSELKPMFEREIEPYLKKRSEHVLLSRNIHLMGIGESAVENILRELMETSVNPTLAPYAGDGEVRLRVTAKCETSAECERLCDEMIEKIKLTEVGKFFYGINIVNLENAAVDSLIHNKKTVATAESCTGGLISKRITDVAGSSYAYLGSVIAYANEVKINVLGVSPDTIAKHGAVSEETAKEMAYGIRKLCGSDIGISTTGVAGPEGGTDEKPVGLVYIGISTPEKNESIRLTINAGSGGREKVRNLASNQALHKIYKESQI